MGLYGTIQNIGDWQLVKEDTVRVLLVDVNMEMWAILLLGFHHREASRRLWEGEYPRPPFLLTLLDWT